MSYVITFDIWQSLYYELLSLCGLLSGLLVIPVLWSVFLLEHLQYFVKVCTPSTLKSNFSRSTCFWLKIWDGHISRSLYKNTQMILKQGCTDFFQNTVLVLKIALLRCLAWRCMLIAYCEFKYITSLANLRWPTRPQPIGSHYFHAWRPLYRVFYVVARFCFSDGRTDGRTPRVKIMTTYSAVA